MRISSNQIYNSINYSIRKSNSDYFETNLKVITGKEINRPADDPEGAGQVIRYRTQIETLGQYEENIQKATSSLSLVDVTLGLVTEILINVKETALTAANATKNATDLALMADKVNALRDQFLSQANARMGEQYLFSGYDTSTIPFNNVGAYQGDSGTIGIRVSEFNTVTLNFPGDEVFGAAGGGVDIYTVLTDLETALRASDQAGIEAGIGNLDTALDQIRTVRSRSGFRLNTLATYSIAIDQLSFEFTTLISQVEDVDMAEAIMNFTKQEFVLQAVLASAARLMQTNLLNFLQ